MLIKKCNYCQKEIPVYSERDSEYNSITPNGYAKIKMKIFTLPEKDKGVKEKIHACEECYKRIKKDEISEGDLETCMLYFDSEIEDDYLQVIGDDKRIEELFKEIGAYPYKTKTKRS